MKEALKYLDSVSFDNDAEELALANVTVSDAQYAIRLAIIEELKHMFDTFSEVDDDIDEYLKYRIKLLESKQNKLNEPI
jgi:hypothetical protein